MSYNPFDFFRRNQKILFAVLTVFIMFMFVLSSGLGRGDFFNWFPQWLGGQRSTGSVLVEIDGKDIKESQAAEVRSNRYLASGFLYALAAKSRNRLASYVDNTQNQNKLTNENYKSVCLQASQIRFGDIRPPDFSFLDQLPPNLRQQFFQQQQQQFEQQVRQVPIVFGRATEMSMSKNPDEARMGRIIRRLMIINQKLRGNPGGAYFVELPIRNERDTIEFLLWRKKADALGIQYTTEDVNALLANEFLMLTDEEREQILGDYLERKGNVHAARKTLYAALSDEFRVHTALTSVVGSYDEVVFRLLPDNQRPVQPFDYFKDFRDATIKTSYALVDFPVESFLGQVTGTPTDEELRKIFNDHRTSIDDPTQARLGIREPKKLKLAWLEMTGKEKYFEDAIADATVKNDIVSKIAGGMSGGAAPASLWSIITTTYYAERKDPALESAYDDYKRDEYFKINSHLQKPTPPFSLTPVADPGNVPPDWYPVAQNYLAQPNVAHSLVGFGSYPLSTLAFPLVANANEIVYRQQHGWSQLNLGTGLGGLGDLAAFAAGQAIYDLQFPKPLAYEVVRTELLKELKEQMRTSVRDSELRTLQDEISNILTPKEKPKDFNQAKAEEAARAFLEKYRGTGTWKDKDGKEQSGRNLKYGEMPEFRTQFTMADDPALTSLTDSLRKLTRHNRMLQDGNDYVDNFALYEELFRIPDRSVRKYVPIPIPTDMLRTAYNIIWIMDMKPASEARSPLDDRNACIRIWKTRKARELARDAANRFAKTCEGRLGTTYDEVIRNLKSKAAEFAAELFTDPELRRTVSVFEFTRPVVVLDPNGPPFNIASQQSPRLRFPTPDMEQTLRANRTKPISSAFILADQPERTYYTAVIVNQNTESFDTFCPDLSRFSAAAAYGPQVIPGQLYASTNYNTAVNHYRFQRELALKSLQAEFRYVEKNKDYLDRENKEGE